MNDALRSPLQDALVILGLVPFVVHMWQVSEQRLEFFGRRPASSILIIGVISLYVVDAVYWHVSVSMNLTLGAMRSAVTAGSVFLSMSLATELYPIRWTLA